MLLLFFLLLEKMTHHDGHLTNEPRRQMRTHAHVYLDILTHRAHSYGEWFRLMIGWVMGHGDSRRQGYTGLRTGYYLVINLY